MAQDSGTDEIAIRRIEQRALLLGLPIVLGMPLKAIVQKPTLKARDLNHVALIV